MIRSILAAAMLSAAVGCTPVMAQEACEHTVAAALEPVVDAGLPFVEITGATAKKLLVAIETFTGPAPDFIQEFDTIYEVKGEDSTSVGFAKAGCLLGVIHLPNEVYETLAHGQRVTE